MKFVIRRAVLGLVVVPVVAGTYFVSYAVAYAFVGGASISTSEVWNTGLTIGFVLAVAFAFATQLDRFSARVIGEVK